jgi:alpha-tubulin suppressor-like RCC1 family protein
MKTNYTLKKIFFLLLILSSIDGIGQCWRTIVAAESRTLAIQEDGTLWSWGRNNLGSLGDGTNFHRYTPFQISTQTDWSQISVSQNHFSFAIKTNGTLWGWGNNTQGYLGNGTVSGTNIPVQIGTGLWKNIACGMSMAIGIKTDGTLWGWGYNYQGELGTGNTNNTLIPILISSANWKMAASRMSSTFAIKEDGTLWAWGENTYGQLGYGTLNASYSPLQVGADNDWKTVVCGVNYTMAIKNNGTLWAWGRNFLGALGDGTYVDKLAPVQIGTDLWENIAPGEQGASIGIKTDHTLWGWGYNGYGQLTSIGSGTNIPTQIGTDDNWEITAEGFGHSVISKLDGTLFSCGYNLFGQVGDNTNVDKDALTGVSCSSLGIDPVTTNLIHIGVYPNPITDNVFFDTDERVVNITVYDISGRILYLNAVQDNTADLSLLQKGNYILKIQTESQIIKTQFIKN